MRTEQNRRIFDLSARDRERYAIETQISNVSLRMLSLLSMMPIAARAPLMDQARENISDTYLYLLLDDPGVLRRQFGILVALAVPWAAALVGLVVYFQLSDGSLTTFTNAELTIGGVFAVLTAAATAQQFWIMRLRRLYLERVQEQVRHMYDEMKTLLRVARNLSDA